MTFERDIIDRTVEKLLKGEDYREEIVRSINAVFLDFTIKFFKQIVVAKKSSEELNLDWYRKYFLEGEEYSSEEKAIYAGINNKTIQNIYGTSKKEVVLNVANENLDYLSSILFKMQEDVSDLAISMKIAYQDMTVDLTLPESLLIINALATKKIQIRGGAWSAIGKKVEKPLLDRFCALAKVPAENIDNTHFKKNRNAAYDREVDYKLKSRTGREYRIEVKLMGKGNPESADMTIARDSRIFVADTLSQQNCNQLSARGVKYLILKGNPDPLKKFKEILTKLDIPFAE